MGAMINEDRFGVVNLPIDPVSVAANTTVEQTFTLIGTKVGDFVALSKPSLTVGLAVFSARVGAADTVSIKFANVTAAPIDPPLETYLVFYFRAEKRFAAVTV